MVLVSRTGLPMQTLADFIELRLSWAKVDLQLLGVLSSAEWKVNKENMMSNNDVKKGQNH